MKAEHRHELKTNALADWLANSPDWAKENVISIIIVAATILGLAGYFLWKSHTRNARLEEQYRFTSIVNQISNSKMRILGSRGQGMDTSSLLFTPAENLETFAKSTADDNLAAMAFIKHAEALRSELHYRTESVSKQDLTTQIGLAKQSYVKALEKSADNASLAAAAKFGLGLCEEELGNFEDARKIYSEIDENTAFEGTVSVKQANIRLDTMADYKAKVVFRPKPIPKKPITINMKPADPNKPTTMKPPVRLGPLADTTPPIVPKQPTVEPNAPTVIKQPTVEPSGGEPNEAAAKPEVKVVPPKPDSPTKAPAVSVAPQDSNSTPKAIDPNASSR